MWYLKLVGGVCVVIIMNHVWNVMCRIRYE